MKECTSCNVRKRQHGLLIPGDSTSRLELKKKVRVCVLKCFDSLVLFVKMDEWLLRLHRDITGQMASFLDSLQESSLQSEDQSRNSDSLLDEFTRSREEFAGNAGGVNGFSRVDQTAMHEIATKQKELATEVFEPASAFGNDRLGSTFPQNGLDKVCVGACVRSFIESG